MAFPYTIDDLARKCKVSKQSIYALIKKNRDFVKSNLSKQGKKIKYNQDVLDLFLNYYGVDPEVDPTETELAAQDPPSLDFQDNTNENPSSTLLDEANARIAALEDQINALKKDLDAAREQNQELIKQNGQVLLLLQEEKQEKMKLLPSPRKSLKQKIVELFGKKN